MDNQNTRNMILAGILTLLILVGWDYGMRYFYPEANKPRPAPTASATPAPEASSTAKPTREGGLTNPADIALENQRKALVASQADNARALAEAEAHRVAANGVTLHLALQQIEPLGLRQYRLRSHAAPQPERAVRRGSDSGHRRRHAIRCLAPAHQARRHQRDHHDDGRPPTGHQ